MKVTKATLRSGLALLPVVALAAPFVQASVAEAACTPSGSTVNCTTTLTGYTDPAGNDHTVNVLSGAIIGGANASHTAINLNDGNDVLNNNGLLTVLLYNDGTGVNGGTGDDLIINNKNIIIAGTAKTDGATNSAIGITDPDGKNMVINNANSIVDAYAGDQLLGSNNSANASATGISVYGDGSSVYNDGSVYANSLATYNGSGYASSAGIVATGSDVYVENTGLVQASAITGNLSGSAAGIAISSDDGAVYNSGKISVGERANGDILPTAMSVGIVGTGSNVLWNDTTGVVNVTGLAVGIGMANTGIDQAMYNDGTLNVDAFGAAIGMLDMQYGGQDYVENTGQINANGLIFASGMTGIAIDGDLVLANWGGINANAGLISNGMIGFSDDGISVGNLNSLQSRGLLVATGMIVGGDSSAFGTVYTTRTGYDVDFAFAFNSGAIDVRGVGGSVPSPVPLPENAIIAEGVVGFGDTIFINTGSVHVQGILTGNAYMPLGGDGVLINFGSMYSEAYGFKATVFGALSSGLYVENYGSLTSKNLITGEAGNAILGSVNNDYVYTSGAIYGNVVLGYGTDDKNTGDYMEVGGGPVTGMMDGGSYTGVDYHDDTPDGTVDQLAFSINVPEKYYDDVMAEFEELDPENGTIIIQGNTYTWKNFEELLNLFKKEKTSFQDNRINPWDFNQTVTGWCVDDKAAGYSFWAIQGDSKGSPIANISDEQVNAALEKAAAVRKPVMIVEKNGKSVWALPTYELQLHDGSGNYDYIWSPDLCGSHVEEDGE